MKSKYYVRVMRPTFQRAILTVEARSEEAAVVSAPKKAEQLPDADWARLGTERELAVVEIVYSKEEAEDGSLREIAHVNVDGRRAAGTVHVPVGDPRKMLERHSIS